MLVFPPEITKKIGLTLAANLEVPFSSDKLLTEMHLSTRDGIL